MLDAVTVRATSAVLVGREAESASLREALKRVRAGEPRTVLVGGEAGIGKTRLVEEFARYAEADGARLLTGQCLALGEEGLPFAPFAAALRELARDTGPDVFRGHERDLSTLLPELAVPPRGDIGTPAASVGQDADRFALVDQMRVPSARGQLFDVIAGVFAQLTAERPLVLIIEDLHWADRSTRDLLAYLIRTARADRALLLVTYRSDELHRGHPLRPFLAELDRVRGVERLDLDRLDRDGTADILANLLGSPPRAAMIDSVFQRAQGNPFFIEELAACTGPDIGCHLPDTLRDLLLSRVDQLPEPAQRVLRIAAAGGNRVGHALLVEVSELPDAQLEDAMRAAVLAQLVVADPDEGYHFRHALVREAVHDDLLPGEHGRLHARYAAAIEAAPDLVAAGRAPVEIAHHWHAANDRPRALPATLRAAEDAGTRYAYAEQSRLLDRVLELWEQVPDAADRTGLTHLDVLERAIAAAVEAGDHARAMKLTRAALSEVDREAEPLRSARLLERHARLFRTFGKSDGSAQLWEAYELAGRVDDAWEQAALLADLGAAIALVDRTAGAKVAQEAGTRAERLGDMALQVSTALTVGRVMGRTVSVEAGLAEMHRVFELATSAGDVRGALRARINLSDLYFRTGQYAEAVEAAQRGLADATRVGVGRTTGVYLLGNLAEALVALGRWDEAEARCAEAARLDPPGSFALLWLIPQAAVRLARDHPGAADVLARALGYLTWPYLGVPDRLPLHVLRIESGTDPVPAAEAALADPVLPTEPRYAWPVLAAAARAADTAGDDRLRALVQERAATMSAEYPAERGYAAEVAARGTGSVAAWRDAVTAWRACGQVYPLARALTALAEAAARAGERSVVVDAIGEAGAIAAELDAGRLRDDVATLARRVGLRPAGDGAPTATDQLLTGRELEVLRLVSEGRSNRQIAEELYISPKTASVHVSRIIAKLGVSNRGEAAAVARRLGLLHG